MKKLAYVCIALLSFCNYTKGQTKSNDIGFGENLGFVGYEIAIPTNADYLTKTSWSGLRLDYRRMVKSNVSVGMGISFNSFDQYFEKQTYQRPDGTGAVTGDMVRQVYTTPLTISVHYYLDGGKIIKPYLGLGLGAQFSTQNAYFNIYQIKYNNWGFVARPEVGLLTRFGPGVGGFLSAAYNFSTNSNDTFNIDNLTHIPITLGIVFNLAH